VSIYVSSFMKLALHTIQSLFLALPIWLRPLEPLVEV
jgi:hypothetical protein